MRKVKYLICFLLITIGFLFNGELFILQLDNFQESFYRSSFSFEQLTTDTSENEVVNDFINTGVENNVDFFMVDSEITSAYFKEINIYGTEGAIKAIEAKGILDKEYKSLFMGKVNVKIESFKNIDAIKTFEYCYYIGDEKQKNEIDSFKAGLIDKYGGGFPKLYGSDKETELNVLTVWLIIISIILILTIYDVVFQKKEVAVRIILGEELNVIWMWNVLYDTIFLIMSFILISLITKGISNVYFYFRFIANLFAVLIVLNALINSTILLVNFKKNFTRNTSGDLLLFLNYSQKTIVTVLVILILSSNSVVIFKGIDYYKQRPFFEENKNYSYFRLNYKLNNKEMTIEDEALMNFAFYNRFQNKSVLYSDLSRNFNARYPIIMINKNGMENLTRDWPFLMESKEDFDDEGYYMLVPNKISLDSDEFRSAEKNFESLFNRYYSNQAKILRYSDDFEVVGIENQVHFKSRMMKNPIVIYDNSKRKNNLIAAESFMSEAYNVMYDVENNDFQDFVNEYDLSNQIVVKSNSLDVYEYNWSIISRNVKIICLLSVFFIILEILLVVLIIQMEYKFNAVEMALKKINGYTIFERNRRLIIVTSLSAFASLIAGWGLLTSSVLKGSISTLWGVPILLIIELIFINNKAKSIEIQRLPMVLKGERI